MIIIYCFCILVLIFAYNRLRKGISISMLHRLRVLVLNFINIFVCLTYWFFLGSFYSLSYGNYHSMIIYLSIILIYLISIYLSNLAVESRPVFSVVLYAIGSKGYSSIIVWLLSQHVQKIFKTSDDDERYHICISINLSINILSNY
jgi:hypothetical protein